MKKKKPNILNLILEKKWQEIDRLNLSEDEAKELFQHYRSVKSLEEVETTSDILTNLSQSLQKSKRSEISDKVKLSFRTIVNQLTDELSVKGVIHGWEALHDKAKQQLSIITQPELALVRDQELNKIDEQNFDGDFNLVNNGIFKIDYKDSQYRIKFKLIPQKIKIKQIIGGNFEFSEVRGNTHELSLEPGLYEFEYNELTFELELEANHH